MKSLVVILTIIISTSVMARKVDVKVPGMVCQVCVQGMHNQFKSAVKNPDNDIKVNLDSKIVTLNLNKDSLSDKEIKKRVKDAGYNVASITDLVEEKVPSTPKKKVENKVKKPNV